MWRATRRLLRSRLALRMIGVFVAGGFLPLALVGVLAYLQVIVQLEEQAERRIRQETKGVAMSVVERLLYLETSLALVADQVEGAALAESGPPSPPARAVLPTGLWELLHRQFRDLGWRSELPGGPSADPERERETALRTLLGAPAPWVPTERERAHLAGGRSVLRIDDPEDGPPVVVMAFRSPVAGVLVWGRIDHSYLWGLGPQGALPARTELAVVDGRARFLVASERVPIEVASRARELATQSSSAPIRWSESDDRHIGYSWTIPMQANYGIDPWTVILGVERSLAFEGLARWRATFPLALLLALWAVLLVVVTQVRRSLDPLASLRATAIRLGEGDFSARVNLRTNDELEEVGDGFDLMASKLGQQFEILSLVGRSGRMAISGIRDEDLLRAVLDGLRRTLGFGSAMVALEHSDPRFGEGVFYGRALAGGPVEIGRWSMAEIGAFGGGAGRGPAQWARLVDDRAFAPAAVAPVSLDQRQLGVLAVADGEGSAIDALTELAEHLALVWHHRRVSRALDQERTRLEELVEQLPNGVVLLDSDQRILLANRLARDYLRDLSDSGPGDRLRRLGSLELPDAAHLEEVRWSELVMPEPFRRIFVVAHGPMGPDRSVVMLRDVTEERELQAQLRQQERLASVGQLAAGMAHDLNNMLQVILSTAELIQREGDLGRIRAHGERVVDQSRRGSMLIRQVLDFSRRSAPREEVLRLDLLLADGADLLRRLLPVSIGFEIEPGRDALVVRADPTQLQQVLTNLVVNARDAVGEEGEIRLRWRAVDRLPPRILGSPPEGRGTHGWAEIQVSDSGPGIPHAVQKRIFEPFFTTKPAGKGTGLGLAQVYGIVEAHGGAIRLDSGQERGTCFAIYLPLTEEEVEVEVEAETEEVEQTGTILVVEDNDLVRTILAANLEGLGYGTELAEHGIEALEVLRRSAEGELDLVISDVTMPAMGGKELVERMAAEGIDLPVLLVSGYSEGEAEALLALPGVVDLLEKPVSLGRLADSVQRALGASRGTG